jgi:RNA polymerase sigma factor (sigma-70 family)
MKPVRELFTGLGDAQPCDAVPYAQTPVGPEDMELLRRYAEQGDSGAFKVIVERHIGWVFNMCRRGLRDRHLAEDASQAVFTILSRKAGSLPEGTKLSGWLFKTTRFAINDARKIEFRYRRRQDMAFEMARQELTAAEKETFTQLEPALDDALAALSDKDRQAVLLHFYQGMSLDDLAVEMGVSREGAKKRVYRAVEKLRGYFKRKGAAVGVPVLVAMLAARGTEAAAGGLASTITATAAGMIAPSGMSTAITEGIVKSMCVGTSRLLRAVLAGQFAAAALIGGAVMWPESHDAAADASNRANVALVADVPAGIGPTGSAVGVVAATPVKPNDRVAALSALDPIRPYDTSGRPFEGPTGGKPNSSHPSLAVAIAELVSDLPALPREKALKAPLSEELIPLDGFSGAGGGAALPSWGELILPPSQLRRFEFNQSSVSGAQAMAAARGAETLESGLFTPTVPASRLDPELINPATPAPSSGGSSGALGPIDSRSVPEPGAFALLAAGALVALRRRRRSL